MICSSSTEGWNSAVCSSSGASCGTDRCHKGWTGTCCCSTRRDRDATEAVGGSNGVEGWAASSTIGVRCTTSGNWPWERAGAGGSPRGRGGNGTAQSSVEGS